MVVVRFWAQLRWPTPARSRTGNLLNYDDLEDVNWGYTHNFPKSSKEEDENIRYPLGGSSNRMWTESPKRGSPDVIKRCETPAGGLAGSTGALYMRTRDSGIPGHPMNKQAQDDFILTARPCGVGYSPNYVVRVFPSRVSGLGAAAGGQLRHPCRHAGSNDQAERTQPGKTLPARWQEDRDRHRKPNRTTLASLSPSTRCRPTTRSRMLRF